MNKEQFVLISLIKQSQFGCVDPIDFNDVNMDALYNEAEYQAVLGLVASEIPHEYSNTKWIKAQYRQKASYILYCSFQDRLMDILDNANIPFVVLKGNSSAISYIDPTQRTMGDIDILVPQDLFITAKSVLSNSGYVEDHDNGRHATFKLEKQLFEIHHHFSHGIDIEKYLISGLKERVFVVVDGHEFPMLPKLANGLVLLDHFRRHLLSSIGLRQAIDWMMYVYHNLDDEFWNNEFGPVAQEKGLDKLAITLTRMCQLSLGLPETITWCRSAEETTCYLLLKCVLDSGNFGNKKGVGKKFEAINMRLKKKNIFHWLQTVGENNWRAYHKWHWLRPFCWIYQIFRFLKRFIISGRTNKQLIDDINLSNERYVLLKNLNLL